MPAAIEPAPARTDSSRPTAAPAAVDGETVWLQAIVERWRARALEAEARLSVERGVSLDQAAEACLDALWRDSLTGGRLPTQVVTDTILALKTGSGRPRD